MSAGQVRSRRGRSSPRHATVGSKHNSVSVRQARPPGGRRWTLKAALLASAAGVMLASAALAIWVFSITYNPVRSLGVIYIAGVMIFTLHEAHDAWEDPAEASR